MTRGDVYLAALDPARGHEQRGTRPVIVFQNDQLNAVGFTVIIIPLTTNLRRAALPSCLRIDHGDGGLPNDSVALCHQLRAVDPDRLTTRLGTLGPRTMEELARIVSWCLGT
jgi:mRNA interferase MazF